MASGTISIGGIHHLRLTVTDVDRSREFLHQASGLRRGGGVAPAPPGDPSAAEVYRILFGGSSWPVVIC